MIESEFAKQYSEEDFCDKIAKYAQAVGKEGIRDALILYALVLYYTLRAPDGQFFGWTKTTIVAALGYFICPMDVIPDMIPITGFADDLAILASVMALIGSHIPSRAKQTANDKVREWFGDEAQLQTFALG